MSRIQHIFIGSDTLLRIGDPDDLENLPGLTDELTDTSINDATVTGTLYDSNGTAISTNHSYSAVGNDGLYYHILQASVTSNANISEHEVMKEIITASASGKTSKFVRLVRAKYQT